MPQFINQNGHTQSLVMLQVQPHTHRSMPTITGNALTRQAGAVLYGHYNMEYLLPNDDTLRLIANHDQKTVQIMLFTHDANLIRQLPGPRASSLVANTISRIEHYKFRSYRYNNKRSQSQIQKATEATHAIKALKNLLIEERRLLPNDHLGQENLREKVIKIIEKCRDKNRLLANNPVVSEGNFGVTLYEAEKSAQQYRFNKYHGVSAQDQMDFTSVPSDYLKMEKPCFVWDSELHIGHNTTELDFAIQVICSHYHLTLPDELNNIPANRFQKLRALFDKLWKDSRDWIDYLSSKTKSSHKTRHTNRGDEISITDIEPYYKLEGLNQKEYASIQSIVSALTGISKESIQEKSCNAPTDAYETELAFNASPDGTWTVSTEPNTVFYRHENQTKSFQYFSKNGLFYPLPSGNDLYTLSQISKRHLYLPERAKLRFYAFTSSIPAFFRKFYNNIREFITHDLHREFVNHVFKDHEIEAEIPIALPTRTQNKPSSLHKILKNQGTLANGQTLEAFVLEHIKNNPYIIARPNHTPTPANYENPFHRLLELFSHISGFFIDINEHNPIVGTLATAAYFYGAGAVLAPESLENLLTKLHLGGLIKVIEPTQKAAHAMNHGQLSESVSIAVTYWQGIVIGGNLDAFFVDAVTLLKDDPAEIAIIIALSLSLGYGLTKNFSALEDEMGSFRLPNYAALGAKGGAAIYDTLMHPGDDWLIGTFKWMAKHLVTLGKITFSPFIEGYYFGFNAGFKNGLNKSRVLVKQVGKQIAAASADFILALILIPCNEMVSLLIHVPFRGISNFIAKSLSTLGNVSAIGKLLLYFAQNQLSKQYWSDFRLSPLYGFSPLLSKPNSNWLLNVQTIAFNLVIRFPLQLLKNLVILPAIDLLSIVFRVVFSLANPLIAVMTLFVGGLLYDFGNIWDNSVGSIFSTGAKKLTMACNWLDAKAGENRRAFVRQIALLRAHIYRFGFEEDTVQQNLLSDKDYYMNNPATIDKFPSAGTYSLVSELLNPPKEQNSTVSPGELTVAPHFNHLFLNGDKAELEECETLYARYI